MSEDATAWLWDTATGVVAARFRGHVDEVTDVSFDNTGNRLATASDDGSAIVWVAEPHDRITWLRAQRPLATSEWPVALREGAMAQLLEPKPARVATSSTGRCDCVRSLRASSSRTHST